MIVREKIARHIEEKHRLKSCRSKSGSVSLPSKFALLALLIASLTGILTCSRDRDDNVPSNLILITLDTTRADHLGCYGYLKAKTPSIDQFAQSGVLFENAFCPSPSTVPSHATMMTGLSPPRHGVRVTGRHSLPDSMVTIADVLKKNGYRTGAVISGYPLTKRFGMNKGFDFYEDSFWEENIEKSTVVERLAEKSVELATGWIEANKDSRFFLWLHLYDPHSDYTPPPPFDIDFKDTPYDGEIAYMDWSLGLFFKKLKEWQLFDDSLIIIAGDHGEGLGEHGESEHQYLIYNSTMRVPLLMRAGERFGQKKVSGLVGLHDLYPTVMDLLKIDGEFQTDGRSLKPLMTGSSEENHGRACYMESLSGEISLGWSPLYAIIQEDWKYINAPEAELYNLKDDPSEMRNIFSAGQERASAMSDHLNNELARLSSSTVSAEAELDEDAIKNLASLGYVSSGTFTGSATKEAKDPKKYIHIEKDINALYKLFLTKQYDRIDPHIEAILRADPENRLALLYAGTVWYERKQNEKALFYLERLYNSYQDIVANTLLIRIYGSQNKTEKALQICDSSIENFPDKPQFHQLKGKILAREERFPEAIESLHNAIALDDKNPETYYYLARCYARMNREDESIEAIRNSMEKGLASPEVYFQDKAFRNLKRYNEIVSIVNSLKRQ